MPTPLLTTELYIPPPRPALASRPGRATERGLDTVCRLMLLSAAPGFGETTLLLPIGLYSVETVEQTMPTLFAWLSLDKGDRLDAL